MSILNLSSSYGTQADKRLFGVKTPERTEKEGISLTEKTEEENPIRREDSVQISEEGRLAAQQDQETKEAPKTVDADEKAEDAEDTSERQGGKVGVNEGKRARQIAAAQNQSQIQQVLALLEGDLSDCKAGLEKGWCDESEIAKVEALINRAKARMSQVPRESDSTQGGIDAFTMASLM